MSQVLETRPICVQEDKYIGWPTNVVQRWRYILDAAACDQQHTTKAGKPLNKLSSDIDYHMSRCINTLLI